jgi:hypothetical protein
MLTPERQGATGVSHRDERRDGEAAAGAFAGDRNASRLDALREEEGISAKRVLERCRKWMLGREAIIERERTRTGLPAGLRDHVTMAIERSRNIAAAVKEEDRAAGVGHGSLGPLGSHAIRVDRRDAHIRRQPILRAERIEALAPLGKPGGPGLGGEDLANGLDLDIHPELSPS